MKPSQTEKPRATAADTPPTGEGGRSYRPGQLVMDRKTRFDRLNAFISDRSGFVVSIPGAEQIVFECLTLSPLPAELKAAGYTVVPADPPETTRIIAGMIEERLTLTSCGAFEPLTEGSTKTVAQVRHHSGICPTLRYRFVL